MNRRGATILLNCVLYAAAQTLCGTCVAQTSDTTLSKPSPQSLPSNPPDQEPGTPAVPAAPDTTADHDNTLGVAFLKHLVADQKAIWTSPAHLHWSDGTWLFPLAAATAGFFASDRAVPPALSNDPTKLNRYVSVSNYGLYSFVAAGGGLYVWSKISHDDHQRETGILAGEAAIDTLIVTTPLKYGFGRARPYQDQGLGNFFQGGTSFPSDHSAVAWSIASVIAHEYPSPFTQVAVYGLATAVSATRVLGNQHFPSDVVVGGAIGWLIGRQVYRAHHDPEVGGGGWGSLSGDEYSEESRPRKKMGSPSVPLDSWVYAAFEKLAGLRAIDTQIMGLKPWTRMECARLTEEASESLQQGLVLDAEEATRLQAQLADQFAYEINLLDGGHNLTANLESLYVRAVSISGPDLSNSYHFGQTVAYDFGRPFERGTNGQAGGSFSGAAGPLTIYVRAEYQHAPSAPALTSAEVNVISIGDVEPVSKVPTGPIASTNRLQLLDSYVGVNLSNWQVTLGKQSLSWTSAPGGSMIWSDNIDPVNMVRLVNPEPIRLPFIFKYFGEVRIDQFFGRLEGHPYFPRPFIYGQKISMKPWSALELGFARTVEIGGQGSVSPLTARNFWESFLGTYNSGINSIEGKTSTEMDWTFYVPRVRNYIVLYGDAYAVDDQLPIKDPPKNPWRPGIYITRFPGLARLDLHVDSVSTEQPGLSFDKGYAGGPANAGHFNYWNSKYTDGYTNGGDLIGNAVGRDGRTFEAWLTYWLSASNNLQFFYNQNKVGADFIPGGGSWQNYGLRNEMHFRSGLYMKAELQYENISSYPLLFNGPQKNITAIAEIGFSPGENGRK